MSGFRQQQADEEIATATVLIEQKRFHIGLKANANGKFLKITEIGPGVGRKNKVIIPVGGVNEFRTLLGTYVDLLPSLDVMQLPAGGGPATDIRSNIIRSENKTVFCDLKANSRGRFLKVTTVTQSIRRDAPTNRDTVVIPVAGLTVMLQLVNDVCPEEICLEAADDALPASRRVVSGGKAFHMDVRRNARGVFMTLTESTHSGRSTITVPRQAWGRLAEALAEIDDECSQMVGGGMGGMGGFGVEAPVDPNARQLWVENIPWTATDEDVRGMFAQCGNIEKLELLTLPNGKAKGIAIVGYSMPQEAHNAIAQLNGLDMGGRPIRVRFDRFAQPQQ